VWWKRSLPVGGLVGSGQCPATGWRAGFCLCRLAACAFGEGGWKRRQRTMAGKALSGWEREPCACIQGKKLLSDMLRCGAGRL